MDERALIRPGLRTALKGGRALCGFTLVDGRRVVLREAGSGELDKLLAFVNGLVNEKKRYYGSVLAELDGQVVGNGEITRGSYKETRHHGHLGLTIRGEYRGLGIGREMVRTLLREAKKRGVITVHVEFLSTNKAAARVYEKAGFKRVGSIPGKVHRKGRFLDSLIMACRL